MWTAATILQTAGELLGGSPAGSVWRFAHRQLPEALKASHKHQAPVTTPILSSNLLSFFVDGWLELR